MIEKTQNTVRVDSALFAALDEEIKRRRRLTGDNPTKGELLEEAWACLMSALGGAMSALNAMFPPKDEPRTKWHALLDKILASDDKFAPYVFNAILFVTAKIDLDQRLGELSSTSTVSDVFSALSPWLSPKKRGEGKAKPDVESSTEHRGTSNTDKTESPSASDIERAINKSQRQESAAVEAAEQAGFAGKDDSPTEGVRPPTRKRAGK